MPIVVHDCCAQQPALYPPVNHKLDIIYCHRRIITIQ